MGLDSLAASAVNDVLVVFVQLFLPAPAMSILVLPSQSLSILPASMFYVLNSFLQLHQI